MHQPTRAVTRTRAGSRVTPRRCAGVLGIAALAVAGAAPAAAAPPDLFPFVPTEGGLEPSRWYVDTSVEGGAYSARLQFPTQVVNGAGTFELRPGAASGPPTAPVAAAVQVVDGAPRTLGPAIRLVGRRFGEGDYLWGIDGVAAYTLTPSSGRPVPSALGPTCREDNAAFTDPGAPTPAPARFAPRGTAIGGDVIGLATCGPGLPADAAGFSSGISTGRQDVIALASDNTAYFDITGVAPGPATFRARVDPGGVLDQGGATGNDTDLRAIDVPGVTALPRAGMLDTAGRVTVSLAAAITAPQVPGRRVTAASPPDGTGAAPAGGSARFELVDLPAGGTAQLDPATGRVAYSSTSGGAADGFTYLAEDGRGLRSGPARVFIDPAGSPPRRRLALGRPDLSRNVVKRTRSFRVRQKRVFRVKIRRGERIARFSLSWRTGRYAIALRRPRTKAFIRSPRRGIRLSRGRTFRQFRVIGPRPGIWRLRVTRLPRGPRISRAAIKVTLTRKG